jgi:hypothetical protein
MRKKDISSVIGTLVTDSPRYADWNYVFDGEAVPLKYDRPEQVEQSGVFSIDMERLTPIQFERLVNTIERVFAKKRSEVYAQLRKEGFKIRALDVTITKPKRNFL